MYMLQLFDLDGSAQPIDARLLRDGAITIGRDTKCDWPIADPDRALSREHCEVVASLDGLILRAMGTNGVFDDTTGERLPDLIDVPVPVPFTFRMGRFRLAATRALFDDGERDANRTMVLTPPIGPSTAVPSDWADAQPHAPALDESLLEAFCRGAGLDASMLSGDDPTRVMEQAGAVYRQMVLGIADLMVEREHARRRYNLARTTIGGTGNNPFKWAPTQRLAIDLLLSDVGGFLSGPDAISHSLTEVKRHLIATFAGLQASLREAVDSFDPDKLEAATGKATLLRSRQALQLQEAHARHADLRRQLDGADGSLERAFVHAYAASEQGE
ncbi:type VI secretion system-associated FHA domain protein [Sphingomonas sp. MMS12-HWE2-04]|uniref:type VI secretion system-associated FHA domain protein n=1 Tax=Sphingomonas sp. MMS12-HWE2-04 TaxID=3234199 RepID=UPI00384C7114